MQNYPIKDNLQKANSVRPEGEPCERLEGCERILSQAELVECKS
jgi:hypothetical protein